MRSWVLQNTNYLSVARIELRQSLRLQTREAFDFSRGRLHEETYRRDFPLPPGPQPEPEDAPVKDDVLNTAPGLRGLYPRPERRGFTPLLVKNGCYSSPANRPFNSSDFAAYP